MTISTDNTAPVANAGPDLTAHVHETVTLDGSQSHDGDGDPVRLYWSWTFLPAGSHSTFTQPTAVSPTFTVDRRGLYVAQLLATDGTLDSVPATTVITILSRPPVLDPVGDQQVAVGATLTLQLSATDPDGYPLTFTATPLPAHASLHPTTGLFTFTPALERAGTFPITFTVSDGELSADRTIMMTVGGGPPPPINQASLTVGPVTNGQVTVTGAPGSVTGGAKVTLRSTRTSQQVVTATATGAFTAMLAAQLGDMVTLTSTGAAGTSAPTTVTLLPPNPATVAPPLNPSVATDPATATAFLYAGPSPVQTGMVPSTIDPVRVAVLRGKVLDASGAPRSGVTITILNYPEFGQTLSRADGMFDLVVNGGAPLTVSYTKTGLLPAQRMLNPSWQSYLVAPDVILLPLDAQVTAITLGASTMQVARGSAMSDADGTRQATVLFPAGTTATMVLPDNSTQPLTSMHVHATEYTVRSQRTQRDARPATPQQRLHLRSRVQRR